MKRFFTISFIALALVVGAAGAAPSAHAATPHEICSGRFPGDPPPSGYYDCLTSETGFGAVSGDSIDPVAASAVTGGLSKGDDSEGFNKIMIWIMSLFAWLVGVAAITLDYAVYYTVVTMGDYVKNLSAVGVTWQVMRDIGNIIFIFGFLAIGICTILDVKWYGGGTSMLPKLLLGAVFLNFSLFMTEAVIDTGNLFATQFYTQIKGGELPTDVYRSNTSFMTQIEQDGVSNKIMSQLGFQKIYGDLRNTEEAKKVLANGNQFIIGFMGIILFLVTAFVMFSLAFVLIARFVILLFLIIVAPIGFAGLAIPNLGGLAKKWWDKLVEQTITAPVLLLCLYIALRIITDGKFLTGFGIAEGTRDSSGFWTGFIANGNLQGFAGMMLSFLVAMGLLLAVVIISKSLSAFGADKASALAGKLSFGATAWGMRTSGGWLAKKTASGLRKTWVGRVPLAGTGLVKGLDRIAGASFDVRGIKAGGGLKALGGIDAGEAQKGGYKADLKARTESRTKYAGELTGRELDDKEKAELALWQSKIKDLEKKRKEARTKEEIVDINKQIKTIETEQIERIEKPTEKGAQRKYAKWLSLGMDEKSFFNKYINFAANTDATKIIRAGAKKAKPDKDWTANMKNLLKEASGESVEEAGASGGGGGAGSASGTGGGSTGGSGGEAPPAGFQQNPGGNIIVPSSSGGGPRHS